MITKKEFVKIINRLKKTNDFVDKTNNEARKLQDAIESDFFNSMSLSISHESIVVSLLENIFNDGDIIGWWIYDLDYGREYKDGCITEKNGDIIDVSTAEKLYDYLIERR
jgi:hypothetical protein